MDKLIYHYLYQEPMNWFPIVWIVFLVLLIIIYEILYFSNHKAKIQRVIGSYPLDRNSFKAKVGTFSIAAFFFFLFFLAVYVYLIFYKEDFAYQDNIVLTQFSLKGEPYWMPIWREQGRFWPLGLQEYNFLSLIGKNQLIYRSFSVFQLGVVLLIANKLLIRLPVWQRLMTMTLMIISPSFVASFFAFVYPERNVIFWLSILLVCVYIQSLSEPGRKPKRLYVYGALISAQFCLYYKEPVFLLILNFSISRLILSFLQERKDRPRSQRINYWTFIKYNYIDVGLLLLSLLFIILYLFCIVPYTISRYDWNPAGSSIDTALTYLKTSFLLTTFLVVFVFRGIYLTVSKKTPDSVWDTLALGGVTYFLVLVSLNLYTGYYIAPVDFIAILYLSQLTYSVITDIGVTRITFRKFLSLIISAAIAFLVMFQSTQHSSFVVLFRKMFIVGQVQLAHALEEYSKSARDEFTPLFFPLAIEPYSIVNFASFLDYKGVPIYPKNPNSEQNRMSVFSETGVSEKMTTLILQSPRAFENDLCMFFARFKCLQADMPKKKDLVIFLPGFFDPQAVQALQENSRTLLAYQHQANLSIVEHWLLRLAHPPNDFWLKRLENTYGEQYDFHDMNTYVSFMDVYLFQK